MPGAIRRSSPQGGVQARRPRGLWSDQTEHSKADDEQEGRDQADRPSDRPELGAKAGDVGFQCVDVGLRGEVGMVGAGREPQLCGERFGLLGLEPGGLEVAGGGEWVEGSGKQGGAPVTVRDRISAGVLWRYPFPARRNAGEAEVASALSEREGGTVRPSYLRDMSVEFAVEIGSIGVRPAFPGSSFGLPRPVQPVGRPYVHRTGNVPGDCLRRVGGRPACAIGPVASRAVGLPGLPRYAGARVRRCPRRVSGASP